MKVVVCCMLYVVERRRGEEREWDMYSIVDCGHIDKHRERKGRGALK